MDLGQYRPVVTNADARSVLILGTVARIPLFASWVAITLHVVTTLERGYAAAGFADAVVAAAVAIGSPWRGRMIDQLGLRRAIVPSLVATGVCWAIAPWVGYWLFVLLAAVAGVFMVPVFAIVRMALVACVAEGERRTALSLDSVLTEVSFMVGPLAGAWAATTWDTRWVLVVLQAFVVAGGLAMWIANPHVRNEASDDGSPVGRRSWLRLPFVAICACTAAAVVVLQGTDLGIVAMLRTIDASVFIGPVLAVWGLGSLLGGLVYGALRTPIPVWLLLAALAAVTAPAALAKDERMLTVLVFLAGMLCAPTITATVEQVSQIVPSGALGEAMGWHGASLTLGQAAGAPLAGLAIDRAGPGAGFWSVAIVGFTTAVLLGAAAGRPRRRPRGYRVVTAPSGDSVVTPPAGDRDV